MNPLPTSPNYPTSVGVTMIVTGAVMILTCIGFLHATPQTPYLLRDIATVVGGVFGAVMVMAGAKGSDRGPEAPK